MLQGLAKLLADHATGCCREQKYDNYFGRKIAIDASMHIYQALVSSQAGLQARYASMYKRSNNRLAIAVQVVVGRTGDQTLTNEAGEVTRSGFKCLHSLIEKSHFARNRVQNSVSVHSDGFLCHCSHIQNMFFRTVRMLESGMRPV